MDTKDILAKISQPIDMHALETVLQEHVYLFQAATEKLPDLRLEVARKKQAIDTVESQINLKVRQEFEIKGTKITEKLVEAEVKSHSLYLKAFDDYLVANHQFQAVDSLREMFMVRESALKMMVSLYGSQYWSLQTLDKPQADPNANGEFKTRRA